MTATTNVNYSDRPVKKHRGSDAVDAESGRQWKNRKRGEDLPQSVLTEHDVRLIRALHEEGRRVMENYRASLSLAAIAEKFEISERAVQRITSRETWSHVL